jgi:translation initiation factor 2 alpha subunit (eIF-2alpha)
MLIIPRSAMRRHSLRLVNVDQVILTDKLWKHLSKLHDFLGVVAKQLQKATARYNMSAVSLSVYLSACTAPTHAMETVLKFHT